ncbi:MAG: serpin family protein [Capsulimonadaceae bacterium]
MTIDRVRAGARRLCRAAKDVALGAIVLAAAAAGAQAQSPAQQQVQPAGRTPAVDPAVQTVSDGGIRFGLALLAQLTRGSASGNIVISPLSLTECLALAYNGTAGTTATEIGGVLGVEGVSLDTANQGYAGLSSALQQADPATEIDIANGLWVQDGRPLRDDYVQRCSASLGASLRTLDFTRPESAGEINTWVDKATHGKITNIVSPGQLRSAPAVLTNAVYFHGRWTTPFDKTLTKNGPFTLEGGGTKQAPMMSAERSYRYVETEDWQGVALPYGNGRLNMIVLLPKPGQDPGHLAAGWTAQSWNDLVSGMRPADVQLKLPRFHADYTAENLKEPLSALGMPTAFSTSADFSAMSNSRIGIDAVVHKAVIDVDEEGTVAAAATAIIMRSLAVRVPIPPHVMIVDHPFLYAITDSQTGALLFLGIIRDPG